ncbi:unnamed protein product [Spodoptera exigua]|nr:unnamed protein product [Spodoptera exigua]
MDKCGICLKPAVQLFETGKDGIYACFKCQPLVPEITIGENGSDQTVPQTSSNTEEEGNESSLYCGLCHKSFQKNMQLQNHLRNHRAERRFVCTYCNKGRDITSATTTEIREAHSELKSPARSESRRAACTVCGLSFANPSLLQRHTAQHHSADADTDDNENDERPVGNQGGRLP